MRPILVVEDNPADVDLIAIGFDECGIRHPVETAHDGEQALKCLQAVLGDPDRRPAMVVLDLNLPRVDGFQVLAWLRAQPALADVAVAVVTSTRREQEARRCREYGATFLTKPNTYEELRALCRALVALLPQAAARGSAVA